MAENSDPKKKFLQLFMKYQNIINYMKEKKDEDNICNVSQIEIAKALGISQTLVSKCLIRLERSDECIVKLKPGIYLIKHTDMVHYGPFKKVMDYCIETQKNPNISSLSYIEQGKLLGMSSDEIKMVNGYIQTFSMMHKD